MNLSLASRTTASSELQRAALSAVLRTDFPSFVRKVFATLNPGATFLDNWHQHAIAYQLDRIRCGEIKRLIIAMPPRSLKSIAASIAFPAFVHGHDPSKQIVCASYGQDLAVKLHNDYRAVLGADWYRELFPGTRASVRKDAASELELTGRGGRLATSVGGVLTGRGADIVIIDDPLKPIDALSDVKRAAANDWFSSTVLSRINDKLTGAIVIVSQRLHVDDLVGHVLERGGEDWSVLTLPAIAPADEMIAIGPDRFHRRRTGDVLHPGREPLNVLEELRRDLGSTVFNAQYLQCPVPFGGNLFHRNWIKYYDESPTHQRGDEIYESWDTASKTGAQNDYSVCTTWLVRDGAYYLLDLFRAKLEYPELKTAAILLAERYSPRAVLVEDAGVGTGLIADLQRERISAIGVRANLDKVARASIQTAKFESGRVHLPRSAPWLSEFEAELLAFPACRHDDQVDSTVQALGYDVPRVTIRRIRF